MLLCMRTTVDINDDLLVRAKKRAIELHKPLRSLIEDGLRLCLKKTAQSRKKNKKIQWIIADGGLPKGLDLADRSAMQEWIRKKT